MANTYKNSKAVQVGNTLTDVYTAPAAGTASVVSLCIANIVSENIFVDVKLYDDSEADDAYIIKGAPVPIGGSLVVIGGDQKVILESSDKLQVQSDTDVSIDVTVSILEVT